MEKQISHFRIFEEIGSGGMGVVYRARDQRLRRNVALKVLPAGSLAEPTVRERLMREAQTASSLNHPHIVTVFDIHAAGDRDFIAMEFVEGRSLDRVIGEEGLPLDRALRFALQLADGLACAHEEGVIHRDLKPQNIMITPADDVKILDFGLAKRLLPETGVEDSSLEPGLMTLTAPGVKIGTPAYMSPEQIESRPIDERSDMFSFGSLFYQMLTGVMPFQRRNAILIFKAVLADQPEPLRSLKPGLPVELEDILARAMEKSPEDRYPTMRELASELEAVHAQLFGAGLMPPARQHQREVRRWPLPVALSLAVLSLAAVALFVGLGSRGQTSLRLDGHRPLATALSSQRQASFSPDGDRIVFVSEDSSGGSQILTRGLARGPSTRLSTVDFSVERPFWSPQAGGRIVFGKRGGGVWSVGVEPGSQPRPVLGRGTNPRYSSDGSRLVVELEGQIWTAAAEGDDFAPIASIPPAFFARWVARSPALSPDGRQIAYFQPQAGSSGSLWVAPLADGEPQRLVGGLFRGGDPVWTPDGRCVVFSADLVEVPPKAGQRDVQPEVGQWGNFNLWVVPVRDGEPEPLTHGSDHHASPAISADGRHIVYTAAHQIFALERRGIESNAQRTLISGRHQIVRPTISPAGDRIAFHAPDGPDLHLFVMSADGGGVVPVTAGAGERNVLPQWSADGSQLYYYQELPSPSLRKVRVPPPETTPSIVGGSSTTLLEPWSRHIHYDTAVDPRERWVVFTPIEADNAGVIQPRRLRVRKLDNGQEHDLGAILLTPSWSADSTEVLGSDPEDRIYLCPAKGGDCRFLAEGFAPRWGLTEGTIHFARRAGSTPRDRVQALSIWTLELDTLEGHKVADIEAAGPLVLGYGFLAGGDLIWNRMLAGHEELWVASLL